MPYLRCLPVLAVIAVLTACSGYEPAERSRLDEVPPGKGAFSGADGAFYIFRSSDKSAKNPESREKR